MDDQEAVDILNEICEPLQREGALLSDKCSVAAATLMPRFCMVTREAITSGQRVSECLRHVLVRF